MANTEFRSEARINNLFLKNNPISDPAVVTALYTDPWYGLNDAYNYIEWQQLMNTTDPVIR